MAADNPEYLLKELQDARGLAQHLWSQCRQSGSSYRLLCGSLRTLRNVLEDFEELELRPDDVNLDSQIDGSYKLLERLNASFGMYLASQSGEVDETIVADFKTSLDVLGQNLAAAHDSISTGEIPLKLDPSAIPALASPPSHWGSTSASAVDSAQERPSTRTSSAYSSIAQDNPWRHEDTGTISTSSDHGRKEVYDLDSPNLKPVNNKNSATATTPSLDWRTPFAFPDPMSTSIEQASNMILRDEEGLTPNAMDQRPHTSPRSSSLQFETHDQGYRSDALLNFGLGISAGEYGADENVQQSETSATTAIRPRATSEIVRRVPVADPGSSKVSNLHAAKSLEYIERSSPRRLSSGRRDETTHLSPTAIAQEFERRNRNGSEGSITFYTRSVDIGESAVDPGADSVISSERESFRKDLSIVFETAMSETDEVDESVPDAAPAILDDMDHAHGSATEMTALPPPPPPPPTRRPPSPPKEWRIPKIPKRSPTYRVVNHAQSDESSCDEEDPNSPAKHPMLRAERPLSQDGEKEFLSTQLNQFTDIGSTDTVPKQSDDARPGKERLSHAQRVLMARAAYAAPALSKLTRPARSQTSAKSPGLTAKLSTQSLHVRRYSEDDSPSLQRHVTSAVSSSDRPVTAGAGSISPTNFSNTFEPLPSMSFTSPSSNMLASQSATSLLHFSDSPTEDGASVLEKETAPEAGPELHDFGAYLQRSLSTEAPDRIEDLNLSEDEISNDADLDAEHVDHIVHFWNRCAWDQAESYLTGYLEHLLERNSLDRVRRVRHLLGVCASFRGQWEKALPFFLAVLRTPISDTSDFDDGDCAAAYWLGDTYSLLNRRTEALLSYRIAEHSTLFADSAQVRFGECISTEQEAVQLDTSLADVKAQWARESTNMNESEPQSILDLRIVTATAANRLFDEPRKAWSNASTSDAPFQLDANKPRMQIFYPSSRFSQFSNNPRHKIAASQFEPTKSWPMMYDPFLSIANVRQGRLLLHESDLIAVFNSNAAARVPKAGPANIGKMESFASPNLTWLITTLRDCLKMLDMEWSEVSNVKGSWFVVRHSFIQDHFATTHYFSISILKHALMFRSGYGVEICPDGICASRILRHDLEHHKGVHVAESKRVKKLIREYLDNAAKQRLKAK